MAAAPRVITHERATGVKREQLGCNNIGMMRVSPLAVLAVVAVVAVVGISLWRMGVLQEEAAVPVPSHWSYTLELTAATGDLKPAQPTTVAYQIRDDQGATLKDFAIAHEKLMHFIVIRHDLQHFQHVHPAFDSDTGAFTVTMTLPAPGPYRLFADFTPGAAVNPQVLPVVATADVEVGDRVAYAPIPVVPDAVREQAAGGYVVTYDVPDPLTAGASVTYRLAVAKNGRPVERLEPYLGALGHSVAIRADSLDYLHTHAEPAAGAGQPLAFSTVFPHPGRYGLFSQWQHEGQVVTADYVVEVSGGTAGGGGQNHQPHTP